MLAPPRTLFSPSPRTMRPSLNSSASTPHAFKPSTMSVMRSLSLTLSSDAPSMRVSPSANAAFFEGERGAHFEEGLDQAQAKRIDEQILDAHLRLRNDQRSCNRECSRR